MSKRELKHYFVVRLLVGIVVVAAVATMAFQFFKSHKEKQEKLAQAKQICVEAVNEAVDDAQSDREIAADDLKPPVIEGTWDVDHIDPWGNKIFISVESIPKTTGWIFKKTEISNYLVATSAGPDGKRYTGDDVEARTKINR